MALSFTQSGVSVTNTANQATAYAGTTATPAAGDLLICAVLCTGNTVVGTLSGQWTWTLLTSFTTGAGANIFSIWWAYAATATSTTPSYLPNAAATGCIIHCTRITGAEGQQQPYIRQVATNTASTANPTVVFGSAPLAGNGILTWGTNLTNLATQWSGPTSFTEVAELAMNTPTTSLQIAGRASGQTTATLTWTNANVTAWTTYAIEFYVAGTGPTEVSNGMSVGGGFFGINTL